MNQPLITKVHHRSSVTDKIALFRALFRGREDVYPKRFENKSTHKSGYTPVCANEWVRGICEKPKIKCSNCLKRRFLPVTDEVVERHLSGVGHDGRDFVMGLYPMLLDETCFFLVADFDKAGWQGDSLAFLKTCRKLHLHAVLERSRSGMGGHVWLFFSKAIPANLARRLGAYLLTETMEEHPDIGLDSYDRFIPNQDTLPKGGLGNLIALPLQGTALHAQNSVFVDDDFIPHGAQWAFLSGVKKNNRLDIGGIVNEAEHRGKILGVRMHVSEDDGSAPSRPAYSISGIESRAGNGFSTQSTNLR